MLKTIIMDFDGLIIDTEVVWYQIYCEWFKNKLDYELSVSEFLLCVGSSSEDLFGSLRQKGVFVDADLFARDTLPVFIERSSKLSAKEGVREFLEQAKTNKLSIVLATSSSRKKPAFHLDRLNLMTYFDRLITAEDVKTIKPAPDLFLKAAETTNSKPCECLVVEDSLNGLRAGINANMRVLLVPNDVTKFSDFVGEYKRINSFVDADLNAIMRDF